jgi:hypothetical protein
MIEWLVNDELERIWKEVVVPNLRYYPNICLEGLRKTTQNLSQDSWSLSQDFNLVPPKYKAGVLTIWPRCSVPWSLVGAYQHFRGTYSRHIEESRMLVTTYKTTWRHSPEDHNSNLHHCENLKSHTVYPKTRTFLKLQWSDGFTCFIPDGSTIFSFPPHPEQLQGPSSLPSNTD